MITTSSKRVNGNDYVVVEFVMDGLESMVHETTTPELMLLRQHPSKLTKRQRALINRELFYRNFSEGVDKNERIC